METFNKQTWIGTKEAFLNLSNKENNKKYYITDLATFGITNEEMTLALTTESDLYQNNDVFICYDSGTYLKGHLYRYIDNIWEDITTDSYSKAEVDDLLPKMIIIN